MTTAKQALPGVLQLVGDDCHLFLTNVGAMAAAASQEKVLGEIAALAAAVNARDEEAAVDAAGDGPRVPLWHGVVEKMMGSVGGRAVVQSAAAATAAARGRRGGGGGGGDAKQSERLCAQAAQALRELPRRALGMVAVADVSDALDAIFLPLRVAGVAPPAARLALFLENAAACVSAGSAVRAQLAAAGGYGELADEMGASVFTQLSAEDMQWATLPWNEKFKFLFLRTAGDLLGRGLDNEEGVRLAPNAAPMRRIPLRATLAQSVEWAAWVVRAQLVAPTIVVTWRGELARATTSARSAQWVRFLEQRPSLDALARHVVEEQIGATPMAGAKASGNTSKAFVGVSQLSAAGAAGATECAKHTRHIRQLEDTVVRRNAEIAQLRSGTGGAQLRAGGRVGSGGGGSGVGGSGGSR